MTNRTENVALRWSLTGEPRPARQLQPEKGMDILQAADIQRAARADIMEVLWGQFIKVLIGGERLILPLSEISLCPSVISRIQRKP